MSRERGQLVLLAAAALALALVPMTVAYLQLGYHGDVEAATVDEGLLGDALQTLDRAVDRVTASIPGQYAWSERTAAATAVRQRLDPTLRAVNTSRLDEGVAYGVTYNQTRAQRLARTGCPSGPKRAFGPCVADRGVVVQARDGRTHVLAVAVDVRVTGKRTSWQATELVRVASR